MCIKYVVDITSLYRPFCQNLFVVWELRSSISSQRTFRTDLLSTAQRRRRVQCHNCTRIIYKCKVSMYVCMHIYIGFVPLFPASPLKAAADLTFFNLRKSPTCIYIYICHHILITRFLRRQSIGSIGIYIIQTLPR